MEDAGSQVPPVCVRPEIEKLMQMKLEVERITNGPKHHMFGFHDVVQTNAKGDLGLALEIDDISRPPLPGESCKSGVVELKSNEFIPIHDTHTWNYPQGARQQWLGDTDIYLCNDREPSGRLVCRMVDARKRKVIKTLPFPVHCVDAKSGYAYFINYDRLHSLGAYGYIPYEQTGPTRITDCPDDDGIYRGDINTGEVLLIASLKQIASVGEKSPRRTGYPHYATHLELNPSGSRLSCLHQYRVRDGGDVAKLVIMDPNGGNMRSLCKGEVSHYTWIDDDRLAFYGGDLSALAAKREHWIWNVPGMKYALPAIKWVVKKVNSDKKATVEGEGKSVGRMGLQVVEDSAEHKMYNCGIGTIMEDGHPMTNPANRDWLVMDTYPGADRKRRLFLYNIKTKKRVELGEYRMSDVTVDQSILDIAKVYSGVDRRIARAFERNHYLHARSGLHCDLHPRWSHDGQTVYFDSIHQGDERQLYSIFVGDLA